MRIHRKCRRESLFLSSLLLLLPALVQTQALEKRPSLPVMVKLKVIEKSTGQPVAVTVFLRNSVGQPVKVDGFPYWRDHFVLPGEGEVRLEPGRYTATIERGPEYRRVVTTFMVGEGVSPIVDVRLERITDLAVQGWLSGELHVHRPPSEMRQHLEAGDLRFAGVITWWNRTNPWNSSNLPPEPITDLPGGRAYDIMGGEDEREGGALLYFGLKEPLSIQQAERDYPASLYFLEKVRKQANVHVDVEKPFWWDLPLWIASGQVDTIGIAHNHMHRSGVYEGEAWGKGRDLNAYPGPHGNGLWTQDIYYRVLDCGLRVPPSAGSASGVLPNPVGYNRVYAYTGPDRTFGGWLKAVRAGRSFVTNGPLLLVEADGKLPGTEFTVKPGRDRKITLTARLWSQDSVRRVEIVHNGRVVRTVPPGEPGKKFTLGALDAREPGWFLVRAIADVPETFRFASTAPFYISVEGQPPRISLRAARFFADWLEERAGRLKIAKSEQRAETLRYFEAARRFWKEKMESANVEKEEGKTMTEARPPKDEADLRLWLENMVRHHRYTTEEVSQATDLTPQQIDGALRRLGIRKENRPRRAPDAPLTVLPYPGGRHPRIGFLDGAVDPQRETKVSVFTPWDEESYVVVDVPEAIFSNLGLTYLAHTHVPTLWTQKNITLPRLEWNRHKDGTLDIERTLPNDVVFGAKALPQRDGVRFELWLRNGTEEKLTNLRVQNCVMLKGARGFNAQTNDNKTFDAPFAVCRSEDGKRWVITAWEHCGKAWGNPPCPCLHSDPVFPDCAPGLTVRLRGWLSFYEGENLPGELRRIREQGWLRFEGQP